MKSGWLIGGLIGLIFGAGLVVGTQALAGKEDGGDRIAAMYREVQSANFIVRKDITCVAQAMPDDVVRAHYLIYLFDMIGMVDENMNLKHMHLVEDELLEQCNVKNPYDDMRPLMIDIMQGLIKLGR